MLQTKFKVFGFIVLKSILDCQLFPPASNKNKNKNNKRISSVFIFDDEPVISSGTIENLIKRSVYRQNKIKITKKNLAACSCSEISCPICKLFGTKNGKSKKIGPRRVIFSDCSLTDSFKTIFKNYIEEAGILPLPTQHKPSPVNGTKNKQNTLATYTKNSTCSEFDFEIAYRIFEGMHNAIMDINIFQYVLKAIKELESKQIPIKGFKGYGKIKFKNVELQVRLKNNKKVNNTVEQVYDGTKILFGDFKKI